MSNEYVDPKTLAARDSFHGRAMTEARFEMTDGMARMLEREIQKSGSFYNLRIDLTSALARSETIEPVKAESMIADVFKARNGVTMNQMRDGLEAQEKIVAETIHDQALQQAYQSMQLIENGPTMPRYRAIDIAAIVLAQENNITEASAKKFMAEAYEKAEGRDFYEAGKEAEDTYHKPVRDAEVAARRQNSHAQKMQQYQPSQ